MRKLLVLILLLVGTQAQEFDAHPVEGCENKQKEIRVAIVGSGIGGSSATFYINQELNQKGQKRAVIDVYERLGRVGGRLHHINIEGVRVEVGGSIYHIVNYLVRNFTYLHELTEIPMSEKETFGVWNGNDFIFDLSQGKWLNILKALWKYGYSIKNSNGVVKSSVEKFLRLYPKIVDSKESFSTVNELFDSVELSDIIKEDFRTVLKNNEVGDTFIDEIATAVTRINYGQDANLHGLAGMISLFADGDGLCSIYQGNSYLCRQILVSSKANLRLRTSATKIQIIHKDGKPEYVLTVIDHSTNTSKEMTYDIVVIAAPLEVAQIEINGIEPIPQPLLNRPYQITHVTIVAGKLSKKYFGLDENDKLPDTIGTTEGVQFSSISFKGLGMNYPVYKIFSKSEIPEDELNKLFVKRTVTEKMFWNAYPVMIPTDKFPPIIIHDQLYYLNAIESALSCMEAEAIAARNIANLIAKSWKN